MEEQSRDTLMRVILNGTWIPAEGLAFVDTKNDTLANGYTSAAASNGYKSNFFAIQDFDVKIGLLPDPDAQQNSQEEMLKNLEELRQLQKKDDKDANFAKSSSDFTNFLRGGRGYKPNACDLEPIKITKALDQSSLTLFKCCVNSTIIDSATIIKRRGSGAAGGALSTYLRMDFTSLLITEFDWDEDDVIKETFSFICRDMKIQYRIENNDGSMGAALPKKGWSRLQLSSSK